MSNRTRNLLCAGAALAVLLASDVALMTAAPLPVAEARRLSAQETERPRNQQDEERMFMDARRALSRGEFDRAAELFQALRDRYPVSPARNFGRFVPDSYYWEAYGRHRQGNLDEALMLLDLARVYDEAQPHGRIYDDVRNLRARIQRQLAEQGDPDAAEQVLRRAEGLLTVDAAAVRQAQRQFEARQQEMLEALREEQARMESQLQQQLERYRAQQDSTDMVLSRERMEEVLRQRSARMALGNPLGNLERELRRLADTADFREYLTSSARYPELLVTMAECPDALVQQEAFTSLLALRTVRMPAVRDMLGREDDCFAHLRYHAVIWLAAEGSDEAWELLVEVATGHPDTQTRRSAIRSLATQPAERPETGEILMDIVQGSEDVDIQRTALDAISRWTLVTLSHMQGDGITRSLTEYAIDESKSAALREQAATIVASRIVADSAEAFFNSLDSENVQLGFLGGLAERVRTGELRAAWLLHTVEHPDQSDEIRASLLQLWAMQPAINLERLDAIYEELENAELRDQLLYSLYLKAQSDEDALPGAADMVIDKMIELARKETDPEVRRRAIYWLGRTGSERAAEFLMEILREESNRPPGAPAR